MTLTLTTLPSEILFQILSHLYAASIHTLHTHPFLTLPLVSRSFHTLTETYTHHLLSTLRTPASAPYRKSYLAHAATHCTFCSLEGYTAALLHPEISCCPRCDNKVFPKITRDTAAGFYILDKTQLAENCICSEEGNVFDEVQVRGYAEAVHAEASAYLRAAGDEALRGRIEKCVLAAEVMLENWEEGWQGERREEEDEEWEMWEVWRKSLVCRREWLEGLGRLYGIPVKEMEETCFSCDGECHCGRNGLKETGRRVGTK